MRAIDSDLQLSLCQESLGKLTIEDGRVPTNWGPTSALPHPDTGHLTENPPEAAPEWRQQPRMGKIILSLVKLQNGRIEVTLIKALHVENFEREKTLTQINDI